MSVKTHNAGHGDLARGGIAVTAQIQYLQPFLSLALAALLLPDDTLSVWDPIVAAGILVCIAAARGLA